MSRFIGASKNRGGAGTPDKSANTSGLILTNDGQNDAWGSGIDFTVANTTLGAFNANSATVNSSITTITAVAPLNGTIAYANTTTLPGDLTLNSSTGAITGSNSGLTANSYTFEITATESKYGSIARESFTILVDQTNGYPVWTTGASVSNTSVFVGSNSQITFAATGVNSRVYSIANTGTLPGTSSIDSSTGVLTFNTAVETDINTTKTYRFTLRATDSVTGKFTDRDFTSTMSSFNVAPGQVQYTGAYGQNGGQCTYTWTAPAGVCSVSVFMMGGGGGGCYTWATCGGAGGGSLWGNGIPVTPGQSYTIQVGRGGCWSGSAGGTSCFPNFGCTTGGSCGCCSGSFCMTGTATTSCGGYGMVAYPSTAGGGGGGAGYCNGCCNVATPGYCGMGGGGGSGTSYSSSTYGTGGGGGTGSCGMCVGCSSPGYSNPGFGRCGRPDYSHQSGSGGEGGSGGTPGNPGEPWSNGQGNGYNCGGCFGGGGGGGGTSHGGGWGGPGVVRILWGSGRSYPCTNTTNL